MAEPDVRARPKVVLVDDDPEVAEMYRLGLEQLGFDVRVEGDGAGLYVALESRLPDIVVLDLDLPRERGDAVLWRLRANRATATLPVVMLSNFPGDLDGHVDRVFAAGALAWLEKAKTPPQLLAVKLMEALKARARV